MISLISIFFFVPVGRKKDKKDKKKTKSLQSAKNVKAARIC